MTAVLISVSVTCNPSVWSGSREWSWVASYTDGILVHLLSIKFVSRLFKIYMFHYAGCFCSTAITFSISALSVLPSVFQLFCNLLQLLYLYFDKRYWFIDFLKSILPPCYLVKCIYIYTLLLLLANRVCAHPDIYDSNLIDVGTLVEQHWKGREARYERRKAWDLTLWITVLLPNV